MAPQRAHLSPKAWSCVPQLPQKAASGGNWALHLGQTVGVPDCIRGVPQLMQRLAEDELSAPHLGQGLYLLPQCGQKAILLGNFFEQLEQYTSRNCCC